MSSRSITFSVGLVKKMKKSMSWSKNTTYDMKFGCCLFVVCSIFSVIQIQVFLCYLLFLCTMSIQKHRLTRIFSSASATNAASAPPTLKQGLLGSRLTDHFPLQRSATEGWSEEPRFSCGGFGFLWCFDV